MSDTNSNRPSHRLFNVTGDGDSARWTDIGVAWATKDGKGFTLALNAIPVYPVLSGQTVLAGRSESAPQEIELTGLARVEAAFKSQSQQ